MKRLRIRLPKYYLDRVMKNRMRSSIMMREFRDRTKIVYIDGVDWQHEVGETEATIWPSKSSILNYTPCASDCGVVKCELKLLRWVHSQNLKGAEDDPSGRIALLEKKVERHLQHIEVLKRRIRHEREVLA